MITRENFGKMFLELLSIQEGEQTAHGKMRGMFDAANLYDQMGEQDKIIAYLLDCDSRDTALLRGLEVLKKLVSEDPVLVNKPQVILNDIKSAGVFFYGYRIKNLTADEINHMRNVVMPLFGEIVATFHRRLVCEKHDGFRFKEQSTFFSKMTLTEFFAMRNAMNNPNTFTAIRSAFDERGIGNMRGNVKFVEF